MAYFIPIHHSDDKAIAEAGFAAFYQANKQTLIDRVNKKNPKTIADIEEACKEAMLSAEDNLPSFELLKQFAYENGEPISNILFAGAIALRETLQKELKVQS